MTKVSFLLVIFVCFGIVSKSNSFSIRLPQEVETYLKNLAVTKIPEPTSTTTIESEKTGKNHAGKTLVHVTITSIISLHNIK